MLEREKQDTLYFKNVAQTTMKKLSDLQNAFSEKVAAATEQIQNLYDKLLVKYNLRHQGKQKELSPRVRYVKEPEKKVSRKRSSNSLEM